MVAARCAACQLLPRFRLHFKIANVSSAGQCTLGIVHVRFADFQPRCSPCWCRMSQAEGTTCSLQFALRWLLSPFAWAVAPLEHRMPGHLRPPVTYIYGIKDWMDPSAGERICQSLKKARAAAAAANGGASTTGGAHDCEVLYIRNAGHHCYLERPQAFNNMLLEVVAHLLPGLTNGKQQSGSEPSEEFTFVGVPVDQSNLGVSADALGAAFVDG